MEKKTYEMTIGELMDLIRSNSVEKVRKVLLAHKREWDIIMQENLALNTDLALSGARNNARPAGDVFDLNIDIGDLGVADATIGDLARAYSVAPDWTGRDWGATTALRTPPVDMSSTNFHRISQFDITAFEDYSELVRPYFGPFAQGELYDTSPDITQKGSSKASKAAHQLETTDVDSTAASVNKSHDHDSGYTGENYT